MANTFSLEILTPERKFFSGEVENIILKTPDGEIGILKGHTPMVAAIAIGPARIKYEDEWLEAVLSEGFMRVTPNGAIILCDTAEWPEEIDINRAEAARERAEERLHRKGARLEYTRSQAALARALARLKITRRTR